MLNARPFDGELMQNRYGGCLQSWIPTPLPATRSPADARFRGRAGASAALPNLQHLGNGAELRGSLLPRQHTAFKLMDRHRDENRVGG
jgi:hypothetical protein